MHFTDTDSLMHRLETVDIYKVLYVEREHFDFAPFDKIAHS